MEPTEAELKAKKEAGGEEAEKMEKTEGEMTPKATSGLELSNS